jgi:hypothetical protein
MPITRDNRGQPACVYPTDTLTAGTLSQVTNPDGTYASLDNFYYDPDTGWLFLNVAQTDENTAHSNAARPPGGPSPLANCSVQSPPNPACPNTANGENYYVCPPEGCRDYVITVTGYTPGPSNCPDPYAAGFGAPEPPAPFHLVLTSNPSTTVVRNPIAGDFPHYEATSVTAPMCATTTN